MAGRPVARRTVLAAAAAGAAATALGDRAVPTAAAATPALGVDERAVSMAMHVHSSFSEGTASMHAHLDQASRLGVDVVMWTDHDFRLLAHGYRTAVRFDGLVEDDAVRATWTWTRADEGTASYAAATFVTDPRSPRQDGRALRLQNRAPSRATTWCSTRLTGSVKNSLATTSLAATVLELDVLAQELGPDAELVLAATSSYRPATAGRPAGQYRLEYRMGGRTGRWTEAGGLVGVVGLPVAAGWQSLALDLQADVEALWPDLVAVDAGFCGVAVSARSRRGAAAKVVLDRLEIVRTHRSGEPLALQREAMAAYAQRYPSVRQHQGSEISLVRHLNAYGDGLVLPTPPTPRATKDTSVAAAEAAVRELRSSADLVAFNHPLEDARTTEALADLLVSTRALGADVVEVGSKEDLASTVAAYDVAARNAVLVTATGVSDDHTGRDWLGQAQRWLTSAWAPSTDLPDLAAALRAGRAWFWDPRAWRGQVDLLADGRTRMGGVLLTRSDSVEVVVTATPAPAGGTTTLVVGAVDMAGRADLSPRVTRVPLDAGGTVLVDASRDRGAYARVEVRDAGGSLVGFSNPLWMLHEAPAGAPAERLG